MYETKLLPKELIDVLYVHQRLNCGLTSDQLNRILIAGEFGGLEILRSHVEEPLGYIMFAKVNSDTLRFLKLNGGKIEYPHEWRNGRFCYILDIVVLKEQQTLAKRRMFSFFKRMRCFAYIKKGIFNVKWNKRKGTYGE